MSSVILSVCATLLLLQGATTQDDFVSPCPRLFVYSKTNKEPGRWDGIVTILSDTDLSGVWLRVMFDRPSILLGNWFGQADPRNDNKEYLIKNRNFALKAHTPQTIPFFIQYDTNEPTPKFTGFRLNARQMCPEDADSESFTNSPQLFTSDQLAPTASPAVSTFTESQSAANQPNPVLLDLKNVCGTVTVVQPQPLITHGQNATEGEFPWHAALYQTKGVNLNYVCGASLVTKTHIITAAHCITNWRTSTPRNTDSLVIYLGRHYLHRFTQGIQERLVEKIIPHPDYNPQKLSNDLGLVKFTSPVEITDYVRPVCLWEGSPDLNLVVDKLGSVVGWGIDETGELAEQLMQAKMPIVAQETCLLSVPNFYPHFVTNRTFCAGFNNGTSVCNGDSGGGMVFPKENTDPRNPVWQLRGVVSLSVDLEKQFKCDSKHYIVFTDIAKHLDWITNTLQ